ncbi:MAG: MATE family efflux transporter [Candidatus Tenebribacter burtonii]|nr:MATE family efflux transporter [Candidatus Tenebribacter burtonii]
MVSKVIDFFSKGHERSIKAKKNIAISIVIKGLSIFAGFLLVPLALEYLDATRYGIWLTLSSILAWFGFFDIGLGNGLRNKFAEAKANGDNKLVKIYVSTTYALVATIMISLFILFFIVNNFLDWTKILNTLPNLQTDLNNMVIVVFAFFCIRFITKLITNILLADQKSAIRDSLDLIAKIMNLGLIFLLLKTTEGSLFKLAFVYSATPVFVLLIASLFFFSKYYSAYIPSIKYIDFKYSKDLMKLGVDFFIIQISAIIIFSTDNMIITQLFGPAEVTPYNIAHKYFGMAMMGFIIIVAPFWSAFTEAYTKEDFNWIKKSIKKLISSWIVLALGVIIMLIIANPFYAFWLGGKIKVPLLLSVFMAFYVIMLSWNTIFVHFINGVGKVRLQRNLSIITALLNIPLSIFFAKYLDMGISGIILGTISCLAIWIVIGPVQYYKIINKTAKGIWNK